MSGARIKLDESALEEKALEEIASKVDERVHEQN